MWLWAGLATAEGDWCGVLAAMEGFEEADVGPGSVGGGLVGTPGGAWRWFAAGWRELPLLGAAFDDEGSVGVHPTRCRRHAPPGETGQPGTR